jgi:flagellar biosynthesis/type III secretory pathway protein FliH
LRSCFKKAKERKEGRRERKEEKRKKGRKEGRKKEILFVIKNPSNSHQSRNP